MIREIAEHYETFSEFRTNLRACARTSLKKKSRLLLVEDEPLSQKYCQLLLMSTGFKLDVAPNGKVALKWIATRCYHGILMDVGLPDISGIDISRIIRSSENPNRNVPIIALTAHLDASKQEACLDAGITSFLIKPVSPSTLCEILAISLERRVY